MHFSGRHIRSPRSVAFQKINIHIRRRWILRLKVSRQYHKEKQSRETKILASWPSQSPLMDTPNYHSLTPALLVKPGMFRDLQKHMLLKFESISFLKLREPRDRWTGNTLFCNSYLLIVTPVLMYSVDHGCLETLIIFSVISLWLTWEIMIFSPQKTNYISRTKQALIMIINTLCW